MKNKSQFLMFGLLFSTHTYAITLENDFFDFNTYGHVGSDFGSKFNYYYNDQTKIISKSSVKNYDESYRASLDSAYIDHSLDKDWKLRIGKLPLIDNVDYQKLGEDIKKIAIDDKINNYDGVNLRYTTNTGLGHVFVNNILGRYKTTKDDDSFYDSVVGTSVTLREDNYKFRVGHSIIEPNIKQLSQAEDSQHSNGTISSIEITYGNEFFKHSNEVVKKNYSNDNKVVDTFRTNIEYRVSDLITPYTEYKEEFDQWKNGQKIIAGGFKYKFLKNVIIANDYKKIYRTFSDYEVVNQNSNDEIVISLGLTLEY